MTVTEQNLGSFVQGTDQAYLLTATRAAANGVPALDFTTATEIEFCGVDRSSGNPVFSKKKTTTGISGETATTLVASIVPADTSSLTGQDYWLIDWALHITESDGRKTTPLIGTLKVLAAKC